MNGILNLSVLDGWWPEGFDGMNGWAIGGERGYDDEAKGDEADADQLYDLLERDVVPLYYDRDERGVPRGWMARAARAIATVTPRFNAQRMVKDYVRDYYAPASRRGRAFAADGAALAADLAAWRKKVAEHWSTVHFQGGRRPAACAASATCSRWRPCSTRAGCATCRSPWSSCTASRGTTCSWAAPRADGAPRDLPGRRELFVARFAPEVSGRLVYGVRAYPTHPGLANPFDALAVRWG
jgi:glycogen phosphorylase